MTNILHELERAEDDANLAHLRSEIKRLLEAGDRLESQMIATCRERDRLRLTDAEREAVRFLGELCSLGERADLAATLRGLLERIGGGR